jgi:sugar phosphate isomerase/epimerase
MNPRNPVNRREFLNQAAVGAVVAWTSAPLWAGEAGRAPGSPRVRLGAPVFNAPADPEELALAHRKLGYRAAYCPGVSLGESDRIRALESAFTKHEVVIAEVGRWVNLMDADAEKRRANLKLVTDGLALADEIGALCCVDIAGSLSPKEWYGPHPDNLSRRFFDAAVENARSIIDAVKPKRAKFAYEMMGWAFPDSADSCLKLMGAVDRRAFGVHLDPCNLVNSPARFYRSGDLLNECFDKLGPWIVSCHAKDLAWEVEMNLHFREVRPGTGAMDLATYLRRLASLPQQPPLMIEHLSTAEDYQQAAKHLTELGQKLGLTMS